MTASAASGAGAGPHELRAGRLGALAAAIFLLMMPETLPVPVLRDLVIDRFSVSDAQASLFMVANMLGALVAAPIAGLWVDRSGRRRRLCVLALLGDAVLMQALAHPVDYPTFLLVRVVEGAFHITALTMLMSLIADRAGERRGRALGALGVGLTLGVATGAAVRGILGKSDPLLTLHAASALLLVAAVTCAWLLPRDLPPAKRPGFREVLVAFRDSPTVRAPLALAFIVGALVPGRIDFSRDTPRHEARTAAIPLYRHPADLNAVATNIHAGRSLDVSA